MSDNDEFAMHVALVKEQVDVDESKARFMAWKEGPRGYQIRLNIRAAQSKEKTL